MQELISETEFSRYLEDQDLAYTRDYKVGPGNLDFRIEGHSGPIYCDVKEIHDSDIQSPVDEIDAYLHLRGDIRKLRRKYKGKKLNSPVILAAMNFSSRFFTGLTVDRALMGDTEITVDRRTRQVIHPLHHTKNAVFTKHQNTSISGVLIFDRANGRHCFFENPYTKIPLLHTIFKGLRFIPLRKDAMGQELLDLGELTFWNVQGDEKMKCDDRKDIVKGEEGKKKIMDLLEKKYKKWELEDATELNLFLDVDECIRVITNFKTGSKLSYSKINKINQFKNDLATILEKCDLEIDQFDSNDETISNDLKYHTIEIRIKRSK